MFAGLEALAGGASQPVASVQEGGRKGEQGDRLKEIFHSWSLCKGCGKKAGTLTCGRCLAVSYCGKWG